MSSRRFWLTFEIETVELDSDGAQEKVWVDAFPHNSRMPCGLEDLTGRELIAAQAVQSRVTSRITTRFRPGFKASMRARDAHSGQVWDILSVILDKGSRRHEVSMLCSTGTNEG